MKSANGAAALELAAAGHPVLPLHTPTRWGCSCGHRECSRPGKHPRGFYGLKSASTDPEQVQWWWHGQPSANVGMRCDGLVVFDVDGPEGRLSLERLERELGELPATRLQVSGRGEHHFYATPEVDLIGNSTSPLGSPPGLDLRAGTRGYVVAAPSLHASGVHYQWLDPERLPEPLPLPWLERLLGLSRLREENPNPPAIGWAGGERGREIRRLAFASGNRSTRYGLIALAGELKKIRLAPKGARNRQLNRSVFRLAQLAATGELELELIERETFAAAEVCGYVAEHGWQDADLVIAYALSAGWASPRSRSPRR
jgi:Bifunctional DNA primase/polymerase, N-terminal